jgi:hypothetical protein
MACIRSAVIALSTPVGAHPSLRGASGRSRGSRSAGAARQAMVHRPVDLPYSAAAMLGSWWLRPGSQPRQSRAARGSRPTPRARAVEPPIASLVRLWRALLDLRDQPQRLADADPGSYQPGPERDCRDRQRRGGLIHAWWHTDRTPEVDPLAGRPIQLRQADPAERLLPGRAQAVFANPSSRAVHPC